MRFGHSNCERFAWPRKRNVSWFTKQLDRQGIDSALAMVQATCLSDLYSHSGSKITCHAVTEPFFATVRISNLIGQNKHEKVSRDFKNLSKLCAEQIFIRYNDTLRLSQTQQTLCRENRSGHRKYVAWGSSDWEKNIIKVLLGSFQSYFASSLSLATKYWKLRKFLRWFFL